MIRRIKGFSERDILFRTYKFFNPANHGPDDFLAVHHLLHPGPMPAAFKRSSYKSNGQ
jgi:hypothetical protein